LEQEFITEANVKLQSFTLSALEIPGADLKYKSKLFLVFTFKSKQLKQ